MAALPADHKYDLYSQALKHDPYPVFAAMRRHDPVFRQVGIDGKTPIWFVTRYADVQAVLSDDQTFVRDMCLALPEAELHWRLMPMFRGLASLPVAWG